MYPLSLSPFLPLSLLATLLWGTAALGAGTASQTSITNGVFNAGDTIPQTTGRLSISYKLSVNNADSRYVGFNTSGVSVVVDTGYDMDTIGNFPGGTSYPADQRGNIGDTISYAYWIKNTSNATVRIYFDSYFHPAGLKDSGPGASGPAGSWDVPASYKVWTDSNNDGVWATGDTIITFLELAAEASDTVVQIVVIPTDANDGESSYASLLVTNRAPIGNGSTTGDGWQDSVPFTGTERDTQYDTTVTTVSGPNVVVSKTIVELSGAASRPGDTLIINITFDNDGSDTARGVEIYDAVPANTKLIPNSADSGSFLGNWMTSATGPLGDTDIRVYYDTDALGSTLDFGDTYLSQDSRAVTAIRWSLKAAVQVGREGDLSPDEGGDALGTAEFQNGQDDGRVEFRVTIK
ncbi:DUF11 domain-containing protein [bacterium]|nr:DUF11 domain-containing protein [bacterium]